EGPFRQMGTVPFSNLGQSAAAFCGLGNPAGFRRTLERCGCRPAGFREFPDHHRYTDADLDDLARWAEGLNVSVLLCTCKDIVKIERDNLGGVPLRAVGVEMEFLAGQEAFESLCRKHL
ncbi:MAG: tetraacyldisaccharide 4'-kinase, partial [Pirellulales bacterium]|nr:tetraacyldisaccharide 4'-kinase [Pirellulales bacterium]